ncbi:hypothetical protein KDL29_14650 [bacterium]|nr:hypothetical protein [bacterium]
MNVKFYGSGECVECQVGMFLLDSYAVNYEYLDVQSDQQVAMELRSLVGTQEAISLPAIVVGDRLLCDPTEDELADAMGIS